MTFTPHLVSGIGALLYSVIGCIVGVLGPELLFPVWRIFGARSVPLSRFASTGLGLFGGFVAGLLTPSSPPRPRCSTPSGGDTCSQPPMPGAWCSPGR